VHSLTKYLGGHGTSIGGAIVDSGKFPWAQHKARFKRLNEPDPSYHGVVYTEALGAAAYISRARVVPLRNTGAALSPFNAFLILQGIETLALHVDRISDNALALAQYLNTHPKVGWVNYPSLEDHPDHGRVRKYLSGKASGVLTFGLKGAAGEGRERGARLLDALQLFTRLVNICDVKSLATHPVSTTHRRLVNRRAGQGRRERGHGAAVDRHRACGRPEGRSGPGALGGMTRVARGAGQSGGSVSRPGSVKFLIAAAQQAPLS
jgi:O-acetylhomoserine (thiol)-lyase